jgi:hypothetical protein
MPYTAPDIGYNECSLSEIIMQTPFTNYGLFHRRRPGRQNSVDPILIPALRGEVGNNANWFSRRAVLIAVLTSAAICATIGVILFVV